MTLPSVILAVLACFESAFTTPTFEKAGWLVVGTLLARGRRTVAAALRYLGWQDRSNFNKYHHVLSRASWSGLKVSKLLLHLLITTFANPTGPLEFVIDETLERRWGRKITKRGHYRDALLSSKKVSVANSGLRWITLALIVRLPWTPQRWALPFLSVLATPPKVSQELGRPHKTIAQYAGQMVAVLRHWLPATELRLSGDSAYSVVELGLICRKHRLALIAPLRLDANLHEPAPPRKPGQRGRGRKIGKALPKLDRLLISPKSIWQKVTIEWYGAKTQTLEISSGTAVWYRIGLTPLPIRWVVVKGLDNLHPARAFFSTEQELSACQIVAAFVGRWCLEVTFEESRAHLGVETQRQWSDLAIERSTPALLGLFSLVAVLGEQLHPDGKIPIATTAWYHKEQATFSDVLLAVRRALWNDFNFYTSPSNPDMLLIPRAEFNRLVFAACY